MPVSKRNSPLGQGLLEVLIAFTVVGLGLGAALVLLLRSGIENRRMELKSIAVNLAREGVEVIRGMRDSNWLAGDRFDKELFDDAQDPGIDTVDGTPVFDISLGGWSLNFAPNPGDINNPSFPEPESVVRVVPDNNFVSGDTYQQGVASGTATPFRRIFYTRALCSNAETTPVNGYDCPPATKIGVAVAVLVHWTDRGKDFTVAAEEHLYDWKP